MINDCSKAKGKTIHLRVTGQIDVSGIGGSREGYEIRLY